MIVCCQDNRMMTEPMAGVPSFFIIRVKFGKEAASIMIIVLKNGTTPEQIKAFEDKLQKEHSVKVNVWQGVESTVLGLIGDTHQIDIESIGAQPIVESVKRVQEPYKKANRKFHPDDTVITLPGGQKIGGGTFHIMAGPCSVECESQIIEVAERVKAAGATFLRGGAFKPRTSPYSFQGLHAQGLELLRKAREKNRAAHRNRDHAGIPHRNVSGCRYYSGRRAQYAEL